MTRQYAAFDIETANWVADDAGDWRNQRPLGISCAATLTANGDSVTWYGRTATGAPADRMDRSTAMQLVSHIEALTQRGFTIVTWNGLGFDFDILAEESGLIAECRQLAAGHVDMMFHFFCLQGYALGLDTAARGMGLPGKPAGLSGALMPRLWAEGRHREVLDYLQHDVQMTLRLAQAVEQRGHIKWISRSGKACQVSIPHWLTVAEARRLPLPDTTWMTNPWPRSQFTAWLDKA